MTAPAYSWSVRLSAGEDGRSIAFLRRQQLEIGSALEFDPEYRHATALEVALAAVGADLASGVRTLARRRRVPLDSLELVVDATLNNPLAHLGVIGEAGTPAIERLRVKAYASPADAEPDLRAVLEEAMRRSPLIQTLTQAAQVEVELRFTH
jgi:hypothetical protein